MTVKQWRLAAEKRLELAQNEDAGFDSKILLCAALETELSKLPFRMGEELSEETLMKLNTMLERRESGEPLQYIEGKAWFMGLVFSVDKRVLIPRQDTETLCEEALKLLKGMEEPKVLDMCTGSGALAISIAKLCPKAKVTAADISKDALDAAKANAVSNGVNVEFVLSDGFKSLEGRSFDIMVCNPPYLTDNDMLELQEEVKREPAIALYGGHDGYDFYRRFAEEMKPFMKKGSCALFEVGAGQAETVIRLFDSAHTVKDLCGIERVVITRINDD